MFGPVLVLNANFEPVNVCDTRRAVGLMLLNKATLVVNGRGVIQTVAQSFPAPSVIRLERMIRRPRQSVRLTKREVFRRDNFTCQYCGQRPIRLTVDHIVPRHLGGVHTWENLVTACPTCNLRKGGRLPEQANMHLLHRPTEPPASAIYLFGRYLESNQEWIPFIEGW
jgi:5-methylcytosine-specific restriction endonuclease McrA